MHRRRSASPFAAGGRVVIVVLALVAWLAISNHCALAALSATASPSHATQHSCCEGKAPAKKAPQPQPEMVYCKVLKATSTSLADLVPALNATGEIDFPVAAFSDFSVRPPLALAHPPTGPPGASSFAEFQRCHRGNAPPVQA